MELSHGYYVFISWLCIYSGGQASHREFWQVKFNRESQDQSHTPPHPNHPATPNLHHPK